MNQREREEKDRAEMLCRTWAQEWIEEHMDQWWDPWGTDIHHALGDELRRQMEWMRSQCADEVGGAAEDSHERITDLKLALAPLGWKPDKEDR